MPWTGQFGHLKWRAVGQVVQWFCRVVAVVCRTCLCTCPTWVYTYRNSLLITGGIIEGFPEGSQRSLWQNGTLGESKITGSNLELFSLIMFGRCEKESFKPPRHSWNHGCYVCVLVLSWFSWFRGLDTLCSGPKAFHMASELIDFHIAFGASELLGMFMPPGK